MHTLADLFTHYLADASADHEPSTQYQYRRFFATVLTDLGPLPLTDVSQDVLRAWKLRLMLTHKPTTVRRYMVRLGCALRFAVECGWLPDDPLRHIRKPSQGRGRVRYLSVEERQQLLAACQRSRNRLLYAIVVVALSTGGRKDEVRALPWTAVDFEQGVVRFLKTKTDLARAVPLLGEARALLEALAARRDAHVPWVFPRRKGRGPTPLESPWQTARARAGIEDFHFHDLRHTFASYLAMSGATLRDIAELLGHTSIQQTMVYAHLLPSHTQGVVEKMMHKFLAEPHVPR
jgi:integrase